MALIKKYTCDKWEHEQPTDDEDLVREIVSEMLIENR